MVVVQSTEPLIQFTNICRELNGTVIKWMGRRAAERGEHGLFARQAEHMASTRITLYCSSLITPSSLDLLTSSLNHSVFSFRKCTVPCIEALLCASISRSDLEESSLYW
jgi:hypothetical protein